MLKHRNALDVCRVREHTPPPRPSICSWPFTRTAAARCPAAMISQCASSVMDFITLNVGWVGTPRSGFHTADGVISRTSVSIKLTPYSIVFGKLKNQQAAIVSGGGSRAVVRDPRRDGAIPCSYLVQSNSATLLLASAAKVCVRLPLSRQV